MSLGSQCGQPADDGCSQMTHQISLWWDLHGSLSEALLYLQVGPINKGPLGVCPARLFSPSLFLLVLFNSELWFPSWLAYLPLLRYSRLNSIWTFIEQLLCTAPDIVVHTRNITTLSATLVPCVNLWPTRSNGRMDLKVLLPPAG